VMGSNAISATHRCNPRRWGGCTRPVSSLKNLRAKQVRFLLRPLLPWALAVISGCGMERIPLDSSNGIGPVQAAGAHQEQDSLKNTAILGRSMSSVLSLDRGDKIQNRSTPIP
jgi:hypothetical protein